MRETREKTGSKMKILGRNGGRKGREKPFLFCFVLARRGMKHAYSEENKNKNNS